MKIDLTQLLITVPLIVCWCVWLRQWRGGVVLSRHLPWLLGWVVGLIWLTCLNNYYSIAVASVLAGFGFRHSAFVVPALVAFSLTVRENYPFSNFPMYSNPDESENYFYLVALDDQNQETPLPVSKLTQFSAPGLKKTFKSRCEAFAKNNPGSDGKKRKGNALTPEERNTVGVKLIEELRKQAAAAKKEMPPRLGIVEVWIHAEDEGGGWTETPALVTAEPLGKPAPVPQS